MSTVSAPGLFISYEPRSNPSPTTARTGSPMPGRGRCLCLGDGVNFIQPRLIEKLDVIPASTTCGNLEIIVTLKDSEELRCLNPKSKFAQNFIKNAKRRTQQ
ncbi:C-X-C motif chemokine 11-1-like isoform X1 [Polyodon spathula]|uniref:C-X-C motif chemokine 11-1-like isoform X1 n=1 Tax=Polyodon spathula TaxID=7913 RepID=UPI001B7E4179|nr:C-X-C motif chemokine 11-1-like isoform X1 [Polyodon spathula]